jgi:hypothetical protein
MKLILFVLSLTFLSSAFAESFSGSATSGAEEFMGCWEVKEATNAKAQSLARGQAELACAKLGLHAKQVSEFNLSEQCKTTGRYYAYKTDYTVKMTAEFDCR